MASNHKACARPVHWGVLLLGLLWFVPLHAENNHCLLWELQGEYNTLYLLGSIHMMRTEDYPLDSCVDDAYQKSASLVVELNIQLIDPQEISQKMRQLGRLPVGETLTEQLSSETLKRLSQYSALPMNYQQMRPWYLALTITLQKISELGYRADLGVDNYLISKAQGVKPVISLETLDQQLAVLAGDNREEQDLSLRLTLEQMSEMAGDMNEMNSAWHQGDAAVIYRLMEAPKQHYPQLAAPFDRLVIQRNRQMADKIAALLEEADAYLVVIGAGHLGGEQGVIALLEKRGFTLIQQPKLGRSMFY
ncbi:MAG: TraB/GumN family protein [Gammaproteobacteria bacterium]|nr:TraB/GumN family protein [Gammaproteobacteria bacterium]MCF6231448.1 TraB/GumN family protein [Gammaproteobacteria bacterium]